MDQVFTCYREYMTFVVGKVPTAKQFLLNLEEKRASNLFRGDLEGLLRTDINYKQEEAFEWIIGELER